MARRQFTDAENERVRDGAKRLLVRYGTQEKLAEALGMEQPSLSNYLLARHGAGYATAEAIAGLLGTTVDELVGRVSIVESLDRYENRARAIVVARQDGMSEEAIADVQQARLQEGIADLSITDWLLAIRDADRSRKRFVPPAPAPPAPAPEAEGALARRKRRREAT